MGMGISKVFDKINDKHGAMGRPQFNWGSVFNRPKPQVPRPPVTPYRGRALWMDRPYRERMK